MNPYREHSGFGAVVRNTIETSRIMSAHNSRTVQNLCALRAHPSQHVYTNKVYILCSIRIEGTRFLRHIRIYVYDYCDNILMELQNSDAHSGGASLRHNKRQTHPDVISANGKSFF